MRPWKLLGLSPSCFSGHLAFLTIGVRVALTVGISQLTACRDGVSVPEDPTQGWFEIGPSSEIFFELKLHEGALYAAAGRNGVFVQQPAFAGPWLHWGLALTNPRYIGLSVGAYSMAFRADELFVGFWPPDADSAAVISRGSILEAEPVWQASDGGLPGGIVYALEETDTGLFLAGTSRGLYVSTDGGWSWRLKANSSPWRVVIHEGVGGVWIGGENWASTPVLLRSADGGDTWTGISLTGKLAFSGEQAVTSVTTTTREGAALLITADRYVYVSDLEGTSFRTILETSGKGTLRVNPGNTFEYVVCADSLYHSLDGGGSWNAFPIPGVRLADAVVEWQSGRVALPVQDDWGGTIYRFQLSR